MDLNVSILILIVSMVVFILSLLSYFKKRKIEKKYKDIINLEEEKERFIKEFKNEKSNLLNEQDKLKKFHSKEIEEFEEKLRNLTTQTNIKINELNQLKRETHQEEIEADIQSFGFYKLEYDFESSEKYKLELDRIRNKQKHMIKDKNAILCFTNWKIDGSSSKGRKMINDYMRLALRAFNGECDSLIFTVKYNNIIAIQNKINKIYDSINKLSQINQVQINQQYLNLKIDELKLVYEYQVKKEEEREEQRRIREEMREEEKARREYEKAIKEAEKEEKNYQKALEQAREELKEAVGAKQEALRAKIAELEAELQEAHSKSERAISMAQMTKAGHVYIISNIGSFGENIYKIGMTRRLEPMDRVNELGNASVPFNFDVHGMIFSEDAPTLENELHKVFDNKRVNKVNNRREFFKVTLSEIEKAVKEKLNKEVEFTKIAQAIQYRETLAIEREAKII